MAAYRVGRWGPTDLFRMCVCLHLWKLAVLYRVGLLDLDQFGCALVIHAIDILWPFKTDPRTDTKEQKSSKHSSIDNLTTLLYDRSQCYEFCVSLVLL